MNILTVIIAILPIAALIALFVYSVKQHTKGIPGRTIIARNLLAFALIAVTMGVVTFTVSAAEPVPTAETQQAEETTEETAEEAEAGETDGTAKGLGLIAAALVTGISGIGGGIAVAAGAPAAIAATSEDEKSFGKSLIFVALGESIALYGVVISILILNKV